MPGARKRIEMQHACRNAGMKPVPVAKSAAGPPKAFKPKPPATKDSKPESPGSHPTSRNSSPASTAVTVTGGSKSPETKGKAGVRARAGSKLTRSKLAERSLKKKEERRQQVPTGDPDEDNEDPTKGLCLLAPVSPFRMKWDIVMLFLILYNVIMVPVRICFEVEAPPGSLEFWFETGFDMLFLLDIVLNFNTAYMTEAGVETNRSRIARNYMRGWFLIDAPSSLPTEPIMELIQLAVPEVSLSGGDEVCEDEGGSALLLPKLLRFLRMARFMKLIRLLKAAKIFRVRWRLFGSRL